MRLIPVSYLVVVGYYHRYYFQGFYALQSFLPVECWNSIPDVDLQDGCLSDSSLPCIPVRVYGPVLVPIRVLDPIPVRGPNLVPSPSLVLEPTIRGPNPMQTMDHTILYSSPMNPNSSSMTMATILRSNKASSNHTMARKPDNRYR